MDLKDCKGCCSEKNICIERKGYSTYTVCGMSNIKKTPEKFYKIPMCPCVECLIKVMCKKECEEYNEYVSKYAKIKDLI